MNSKAVSPLIGFILLLAIIMGFIGIVQSTWVPEWNKAAEAKHLDEVGYEVAKLSEAVSLAASTGNPAKVIIDAGVKYPEYYILISPSKGAGSVGKRELRVNISGITDSTPYTENFTSYAITYRPNYLYSHSPEFVFEHSAVLKIENSHVLVTSEQNSFTNNKITIYIVNATFNPLSTTENINLILYPISYGGSTKFSGTVEFECYDEKTASWWNETLSSTYGSENVTQDGRKITLSVSDVELSINYFVTTATSAGEVEVGLKTTPYRLQRLSEASYTVYEGTTIPLGVRVVDRFNNPVRDVNVSINDSCHDKTLNKTTNDKGEVWYYFPADSPGKCRVEFNVSDAANNVSYWINVSSSGGKFSASFSPATIGFARIRIYHGPIDGVIDPSKNKQINSSLYSPSNLVGWANSNSNGWAVYDHDDIRLAAYDDGFSLSCLLLEKCYLEEEENDAKSTPTTQENHASQLFEFNVGNVQTSRLKVLWNGIAWLDYRNDKNDGVVIYVWNGTSWEYLCHTTSSSEVWLGLEGGECEKSGNYVFGGKVYVLLVQAPWTDTWQRKNSHIKTDYIQLDL